MIPNGKKFEYEYTFTIQVKAKSSDLLTDRFAAAQQVAKSVEQFLLSERDFVTKEASLVEYRPGVEVYDATSRKVEKKIKSIEGEEASV